MEYVERVYPYAEVHKLMSRRFWLVSFDELVGDRNLRRIVAHRNLACTGVELALSWLCWYEGNIFVDLQCAVADLRYAHPWRVTSLVLAMVCEFPDVCVSDLEYVRIGSRLLERIESEYRIGKSCCFNLYHHLCLLIAHLLVYGEPTIPSYAPSRPCGKP